MTISNRISISRIGEDKSSEKLDMKSKINMQINVKSAKAWVDKQCSEVYYTPCQDECWVEELGGCG